MRSALALILLLAMASPVAAAPHKGSVAHNFDRGTHPPRWRDEGVQRHDPYEGRGLGSFLGGLLGSLLWGPPPAPYEDQ